jgi:RHS repeat-associated protein
LSSWSRSRTACASYGYDKQGNRATITPSGGTSTTLSYDQANRLTAYGSTATYTYDGDGLRASKTVGASTKAFTWDQSGELPLLLADGGDFYVYGENGTPIEKISGTTITYLHQDQQGSTRLLTDASGAITGTYNYAPFGQTTSHTGSATSTLQYDGQYTDAESGFQYLRARYYDPGTAQFLSRDPLVSLTQAPYSYAAENPLNGSDPTGLSCGWMHPLSCVSSAAGAIGQWVNTPIELPNSRFITGFINTAYGVWKVENGIFLVTVGTAEDVTGIGALLGVPTQAYGVYQITTGLARIYRGYRQYTSAWKTPTVCKSPPKYGEDIGLDLIPGGGILEGFLGGLP